MASFNPFEWNWNQLKASGKHWGSYLAGGLTVAVAFHLLTPAQSADLTSNVDSIVTSLEKIVTAIAAIAGIITPIYTSFRAANNASPSSQVKSVLQNLSAPEITQAANAVADPTSRNKLIQAVAEMPEVKIIDLKNPAMAEANPSPKVVSQ